MTLMANGVTDEMRRATDEKFRTWDEVVEKNLIEGTFEQQSYVYGLLHDPTIYFYAFFKNREQEPFKLYPYQQWSQLATPCHFWVTGSAEMSRSGRTKRHRLRV